MSFFSRTQNLLFSCILWMLFSVQPSARGAIISGTFAWSGYEFNESWTFNYRSGTATFYFNTTTQAGVVTNFYNGTWQFTSSSPAPIATYAELIGTPSLGWSMRQSDFRRTAWAQYGSALMNFTSSEWDAHSLLPMMFFGGYQGTISDFSENPAPSPLSSEAKVVSVSSGRYQIQVKTSPGQSYQLTGTSSLDQPFSTIGYPDVGDGGMLLFDEFSYGSQFFWKLEITP